MDLFINGFIDDALNRMFGRNLPEIIPYVEESKVIFFLQFSEEVQHWDFVCRTRKLVKYFCMIYFYCEFVEKKAGAIETMGEGMKMRYFMLNWFDSRKEFSLAQHNGHAWGGHPMLNAYYYRFWYFLPPYVDEEFQEFRSRMAICLEWISLKPIRSWVKVQWFCSRNFIFIFSDS